MKRYSAISVLALLVASPALAADLTGRSVGMKDDAVAAAPGTVINWTSVYVGGQVGVSNSNHNIGAQQYDETCTTGTGTSAVKHHYIPGAGSAEGDLGTFETLCAKGGGTFSADPTKDANAFINGLDSHGEFAGARLGADWARGHWLVGAFGDYNFSNAKTKAGAGGGEFTGSIEDGDSWVIAARAGYLFGEEKRALLYVLAGYGQQDVSYNGSLGAGPNAETFHKDVTFGGFVAGAGAEYALNNLVTIGLEWQHSFGGKENLFDNRGIENCDALTVDDKMSSDKIMGRVNFKVGPGLFGN